MDRPQLQLVQLYGTYSDLELFSNFTYFLEDPIPGDQFSQTDRHRAPGRRPPDKQR